MTIDNGKNTNVDSPYMGGYPEINANVQKIQNVDSPHLGVSSLNIIPNLQKNVFGYFIYGIGFCEDIGILIKDTPKLGACTGGFDE